MSTEVTTDDDATKCDGTTETKDELEAEDNHTKEDEEEKKEEDSEKKKDEAGDPVIKDIPFKVDLNESDPEKRCSAENALKDPPKQSWLLRLFESKLFDMTIAITYLYNSKDGKGK